MDIKEIVLKYFPHLNDPSLLEEIAAVGKLDTVDQGEILLDIDEPIKSLPLIYEGVVKVHREDDDGNEILLYFLESGSTCATALTCCMSNQISTIRAEAEEHTSFIAIPIAYLDQWIAKYSCWKEFVFGAYANRFDELLHAIDALAFHKLDDRLYSYLLDRSNVSGNPVIKVSHRQIAYDLNSSREVISRVLKQLENSGRIQMGRGEIELLGNKQDLKPAVNPPN